MTQTQHSNNSHCNFIFNLTSETKISSKPREVSATHLPNSPTKQDLNLSAEGPQSLAAGTCQGTSARPQPPTVCSSGQLRVREQQSTLGNGAGAMA